MPKPLYAGVDFGTSNTVFSVAATSSQAHLVCLEDTAKTIPSAMFYPATGGPPLFGRTAQKAYHMGEEGRFMRSLKRVLGTSLMEEGTLIGSRRVPFAEIITAFIRHLREQAEGQVGQPLPDVVAGRPVHFVDGDKAQDQLAEKQLEKIFKHAGFRHVLFQYEPIAAAFAHEIHLPARDHLALVVDIGGGTSDFSVIRLSGAFIGKTDRSQDILGSSGLRLGGNDFDRALSLQNFMPLLGMGAAWGDRGLIFPSYPFFDLSEWSKIPFMYTPKYRRDLHALARDSKDPGRTCRLVHVVDHEKGHAVLGVVEDTKITLSADSKTTADLNVVEQGLTMAVTRTDLERALAESCNKISAQIQESLAQAGLKGPQVDLVILTGGGTAIPAIQTAVRTICPQAQISGENMLASVGLGLAHDAGRRFG